MKGIINMTRRDFLKTGALLGGGLVLGFSLTPQESSGEATAQAAATFAPNAFIRIAPDDSVTIIINKAEMGQGVYTALPMLIAEELSIDWKKVLIEAAPVAPEYNHTEWKYIQGTGGSSSIRSSWVQFRKAGASARIMLVAAAAELWHVDPAACRVKRGFVIHDSSHRRLSFGKLADKAALLTPPKDVELKQPEYFTVIGKPMRRVDARDKTTGTAVFGLDIKSPGMLTAVVARPPVFGGRVKSFNPEKARAVEGVKAVVQIDSGIAVVADHFWTAKTARDALEIVWDESGLSLPDTEALRKQYDGLAAAQGAAARRDGDAAQAFAQAARQISAEYEVPYLAHAPMETLNCFVDLHSDRCDIWTGTQFQTVDRDAAARVSGLAHEQVKIHTTYLGGGFGRRANPLSDFVTEAVNVAKAVQQPVKTVWTREDDIKGGYYRPMWRDRISAGLDAEGKLTSWQHTIVGQSIVAGTSFEPMMVKNGIDSTSVEGADDIPYAIANILVSLHTTKIGVPVQWWRSVGHSHTAFVVETFIDEAAHAVGKDPYEFRRGLLAKQPRHKAVLDLVAQKSRWGEQLKAGRKQGMAVHKSFNSYVAQTAEVSVSKEGAVRVHKVVCAVDCGRVVNPDIVKAQMESGIVFGLSAALFGAITFKNGRVEQNNFYDYPILRMKDMPEVEVHIIKSDEPPTGVGEPGVPPIAPAVANAVFAATGARLRQLPMTADAVLKAIKTAQK
ncbi:MAG: xanthine dehydrogenase family protein molybdopterin-binding subunit [Nitrospirae bacterium]|nr:xanthine dehydrogenase family protein molybdopterin-binding subunit [Nitrospirota bacterium]